MSIKLEKENDLLIISKDQIGRLCSRLWDKGVMDSCVTEIQRMIEIKSAMCAWADERSTCCGTNVNVWLFGEVQLLENVLSNVNDGRIEEAVLLLEDYCNMLPEQRKL